MKPLNILGIAGSLRGQSYSHAVLASLSDMLPAGSTFKLLDIGALPYYNQDLEAGQLPDSVKQARTLTASADAVLLALPEYNHGIPGVLKNSLDWLSRPFKASPMAGKPVFFVTQSEGGLGGVRAQYQLRETLSSMLCVLPPMPEMAITFVHQKVKDGKLSDDATLSFIGAQLNGFLAGL